MWQQQHQQGKVLLASLLQLRKSLLYSCSSPAVVARSSSFSTATVTSHLHQHNHRIAISCKSSARRLTSSSSSESSFSTSSSGLCPPIKYLANHSSHTHSKSVFALPNQQHQQHRHNCSSNNTTCKSQQLLITRNYSTHFISTQQRQEQQQQRLQLQHRQLFLKKPSVSNSAASTNHYLSNLSRPFYTSSKKSIKMTNEINNSTNTTTNATGGCEPVKRATSTLSTHVTPVHQLSVEATTSLSKEFYNDEKNKVALHACTKMDPLDVCLTRSGLEDVSHVYSHKVETEGKPMCNQKQSGRCWLFAFLNAVRVPFMKQYNIDEFEFSQNYLFFWDKLERANHFLNVVVEAVRSGENSEGRLLSFLLRDPISDGGQWDMIVNLVHKYGLMPKRAFPETFSSEASARMNAMLRSKLREFTKDIAEFLEKKPSENAIQELIRIQMKDIYKIVAICLGVPKSEFVWEYYDKSKAYHKVGPITPLKFYEEHVKPIFDIDDKVCLIHDPRPKNHYGRLYSVQYLGNMTGGRSTTYNNQPINLLKKLVVDSVKAGEVVWFGCEVQKRFAAKQGLQDLTIHDYPSVFGLDVSLPMSKAERLLYGESSMSHAMAITAVGMDNDSDVVTKFRVENSWGDDRGEKGYLLMTTQWFDEFVFEVVIDKAHVPQDVLDVFNQEPIVLPAWDPMGTLA